MKFRQLQCVYAVYEHGFSVTKAAQRLHTSQPAVSKQIKSLEDFLDMPIFERGHKRLTGLSDFGVQVLPLIEQVLKTSEAIVALSNQQQQQVASALRLATTNTLALYRLAPMMADLHEQYPQLPVDVVEGTNAQILQLLLQREVDFGWISALDLSPYTQYLPDLIHWQADSWSPIVLVPSNHALAQRAPKNLAQVCAFPLITYVTSHPGPSGLLQHIQAQGIQAKVVLTARSSSMIKDYVRQGMGVGIIADMAFDAKLDVGLSAIALDDWLPAFHTYLLWHRHKRLKPYHYFLIKRIIAHADDVAIKEKIRASSVAEALSWSI